MEQIVYVAGGCFWGVQGYFDLLHGVIATQVGYANSKIENPSYEMVCSGITNAVEAVEILYDDMQIPLCDNTSNDTKNCLLSRFFSIIDPCALNYQGNDSGTQYRNGIYIPQTTSDNGAHTNAIIEDVKTFIEKYITPRYKQTIVTEVMPLTNFYLAEAYHQKYLTKNPHGYCHIDIEKAMQPLNL